MISYIAEVSLYWTLGYILYRAVFRRWTLFTWNRLYLLTAVVVGALLPLIPQSVVSTPLVSAQYLPQVLITVSQDITALDRGSAESGLFWVLPYIYGTGVLCFMGRTFFALWPIRELFLRGTHSEKENYTLIRTKREHPPFAFGRWIFIDDQFELDQSLQRIILRHERAHVAARHTVDILVLELMNWIFWFHPLIYLYRTALRMNHEFSADADVLKKYSKHSYGKALLKVQAYRPEWHLTRSFHFSKLKKRFIMMNSNTTDRRKRWYYLAMIPLLFIAFVSFQNIGFSNTASGMNNVSSSQGDTIPGDGVYVTVDQMPVFPGCEEIEEDKEQRKCADQKLMKYVYRQVEYPAEARKSNVEGMAVVSFVVGKNGAVRQVKLEREAHESLDRAALKAVRSMRDNNITWSPGRQNGEAVAVRMTLPVRFALPKEEGTSDG